MSLVNVDPDELARLEEERDFLLRSLRDLDRERGAGDISEEDYRSLHDGYTARAASVLRAIEEGREALPPPRPGRGRRLVVGSAVVAALAVGAGVLVARTSGERLAGQQASGSITTGNSSRLARARELVGRQRVVDALKVYDDVLRDDPKNPEALAYRGWLTRLAGLSAEGAKAGLVDKGLAFINRAITADPSYPDAHFFRAVILYRDRNNPSAAVPEFKAFLANDPPPEMVNVVEQALRQAQADLARRSPPVRGASSTTTAP